jgi:hypothetical protein
MQSHAAHLQRHLPSTAAGHLTNGLTSWPAGLCKCKHVHLCATLASSKACRIPHDSAEDMPVTEPKACCSQGNARSQTLAHEIDQNKPGGNLAGNCRISALFLGCCVWIACAAPRLRVCLLHRSVPLWVTADCCAGCC